MYRKKISRILFLAAVFLLYCSLNLTYAQTVPSGENDKGEHKELIEGKKVGQKSETPPGWEKGLKKGWEKSTPPGWDNWDKKARKRWEKDLNKAKKSISKIAKKKGWNVDDRNRIIIAIEFTVRKGVPVRHAKKVINECVVHGLKGEASLNVAITLSKGVNKGMDYKILGSQVVEKIRAGYRGKKLANEIHVMIEKRHKAKMETKDKKIEKPIGKEKPKPKEKEGKSEKIKREKQEQEKEKSLPSGKKKGGKGKRK